MRTAVILAARKEYDTHIPYPLQPVLSGKSLLDRTLGILEDLEFSNIIIVAGYKAELFSKYESDTVHIVVNKNYQFTASMGSLAVVAPFIEEDFLLIEGDVFYERCVLEELCKTRYENCLAVTEESGNGDEAFVETKNNFVRKISKDRHQLLHYNGELLGLSKISKESFRRMVILWEQSTNPLVNYEYVFFDVTETVDRPFIYFKNLIWGEVDNKADYEKLKNYTSPKLRRKENPFDKENLIVHLQTIFPERDVTQAEIVQLGGLSNKNFKVTLGNDVYVLRVPGSGSEGMVERRNEEVNSLLACQIGINPDILYFNNQTGVKLARFIQNAETLNAATVQRPDNMRQIATILRKLHNSGVRFNNEFNLFHEILKYEDLMRKAGATMYDGWEPVREKVMALESHLNNLGVDLRPCHTDLLYENLIKDEQGKIYLIDWEYSGINDPMADFAALFIEAGFTEDNEDFILKEYFDDNIIPSTAKQKILIYEILFDYLWAIWTVIKEANGNNYETYGQDRFNRSIENLQKLNDIYDIQI